MVSLLDRPPGPPAPLDVRPAPAAAAAAAAGQAAAASLVAVLAPVVLAWVVDSDGRGTWLQAVRLSLALWLLAQHGGIAVAGGHVGLVPLGLTLAPLAACWFGGRRLSRLLDPRAEAYAAGASRAGPTWPPAVALASFAATYCLAVAAAALVADMPGAHPIGLQAVIGGAVVASASGTLGAASYRYGGVGAGLHHLRRILPAPAVRWSRPALAALVVQLLAAAVVLIVMIGAGRDRVLALHRALEPGVAGGAVLALGQILLLPNLVVWTAAALAGTGFAVGSASWITLASAQLGPLPAVPVLGALPGAGPMPRIAMALLVVPVSAGVVGGVLLVRAGPGAGAWGTGWRAVAADVGGVGGLVAASSTALAWLSGGPAGPGNLAVTGPEPIWTGAAVGAEVAVGVALALAGAATWRRWRPVLPG
ncbi:MAG TPA: DUF6350 family protein [Kineosporiaceae bacterium]|nr:DUF6350 family protein [Kineosporiaceae bacterium]